MLWIRITHTWIRDIYIYIYKLLDQKWSRVYEKIYTNSDPTLVYPVQIGNVFGGYEKNRALYQFRGNSFAKFLDVWQFGFPGVMQGISLNDFLIEGHLVGSNNPIRVLHWNGAKWSLERRLYSGADDIRKVNANYYLIDTDYNPYRVLIWTGRPRNPQTVFR